MRVSLVKPMLLLTGFVLLSGLAVPAFAATNVGGTTVWTIQGAPSIATLQGYPTAVLTFQNNLGVPVLGIVVVVIHNSQGQTVYFSADTTLDLAAGGTSTAYAVILGLTGSYNMTFFAVSTSGVAISAPTTATLAA